MVPARMKQGLVLVMKVGRCWTAVNATRLVNMDATPHMVYVITLRGNAIVRLCIPGYIVSRNYPHAPAGAQVCLMVFAIIARACAIVIVHG